jgi:acetyl esterase
LAQGRPVLGSHEPIHVQRAAHDRFIDTNKPPIGKVEHLGLDGPHGTIPVRCYHPSKPGIAEGAALVYLHGGGYIVGSLDQFDTAMRLFAETAARKSTPSTTSSRRSTSFRSRSRKMSSSFAGSTSTRTSAASTPRASRSAATRPAATRRASWPSSSATRAVPSLPCRCRSIPRPRCRSTLAPVLRTAAARTSIPPACFSSPGAYIPQGVDYSQPYITPLNAPSHADLPKTLLVTCGFDMLRDVAHAYGLKLAAAGNDLTYVHYDDLPHGFIQMTRHSKRCWSRHWRSRDFSAKR